MKRIIILLFLLVLVGCSKEQSTTAPIIPERFEGLWGSFSSKIGTLSISVEQKGDSLSGTFTLVYASTIIYSGNVSGLNQYPNINFSLTQVGSVKATYAGKFLEPRVVSGSFTGYTFENEFLVLSKQQ